MSRIAPKARQGYNTPATFLLAAVLIGAVLTPRSVAAPGDLDPSFGNGGIVVTQGTSFGHLNTGNAMAVQADGKIVLVGGGQLSSTYDFAIVRYNTDGSLDTSFGGTGIILTSISDSHDQALAVAIQADGKIVVGGESCVGNCLEITRAAVVRYNTDGSLDTSFNGTGKVTNATSQRIWDLAIQPDGKIVAVGGEIGFRFNADGSLDSSFGGTGRVSLGIEAESAVIQADGRILAAGRFNGDVTVARYNTDGSPDLTFNGTGRVTTQVGNIGSRANALVLQPDGRILAAGNTGFPYSVFNADFLLVRYEPSGALDLTFGGTGVVVVPIGDRGDAAFSVAIQTNGKIVAAGHSYTSTGSDFALLRLDPNGSVDITFNGTGKVTTHIGNLLYDGARSAAIQSGGKIVVAGSAEAGLFDFYDFAVVRYHGGARSRFDYDGDGRSDVSVFRPSTGLWYLLRSTAGYTGMQWGEGNDKITPGDFDGDGKTDVAVFRASTSTWYIFNSATQTFTTENWGQTGDLAVPADYDGDGKADVSVYRPSDANWYRKLSGGGFSFVNFGTAEDKPVPADYDGDGRADIGVFRPSSGIWYFLRTTAGFTGIQWGVGTDIQAPGDYDGDGKTDVAVFRPENGTWYLGMSTSGFASVAWGQAGDVPSAGDYDGDGKTDVAVFRPSNGHWYILNSSAGIADYHFGESGDLPTESAFRY